MAPTPQQDGVYPIQDRIPKSPTGEEVVISGISGIFPSSDNTVEFMENLYNNVDMVTENDLNFHHPEAPRHFGQINGLTKFDAQFFRVTYHHALTMEPVSRKLLEQAYMAIYDSGINPLALKGKKVGVFIGTSYSDTSNVAMYNSSRQKGFILSGCGKSMFSNRISYWIDAKGPSYSIDCSCASSMVGLEHAYQAMANGECEAAIVGGGNICKLPQLGLNLRKGGMACLDGKTKCFSKNGDGSVRAEAINCIFLQKAKDAKRIYAEVCFAQVEYGLKEDAHFLPMRKSEDISEFLKNFYANVGISPTDVDYIEANGSGIDEADSNELKAIGEVFTKGKHKPVKVGSVKSYMGNAEPASGVCAITKVCLAYHKGKLPANLHYTEPVEVPELKEGKIEVVQKNETFNRGYTAVNQFSFNGVNCHVLLKGHYKPKDTSKYKTSIPRLVLASGRQNECIQKIFDTLVSQPLDPEVIGLLHNIYQIDTPGHTSRGYTILDSKENNETISLSQNAEYYSGAQKPLCLVFSGMGSQWPGMAAELMRIPLFSATIQKCHEALKPFDVDLIRVLTEPDKTMFDNILNCFIGISAVQIGLTDVLKEIGLNPDYIIGHSQGEMCCAYWDGCFTTEEAILAAYTRGIVSLQSNFEKGAMAAIGLGYKDILPLCPPEIDVACHNSNESATLSGPADALKDFVAELTKKNIFARIVPSANIAFHSRYIQRAGPEFSKRLRAIIDKPKLRSNKWICTSVPQERWNEDIAKYSSAEFHTNNLLSPVYFEESAQLIPKDAVVVEVAPHGLLQAILKRSHSECTHIPLTKRGHEDPLKYFFESIGKLYQEGYNFNIERLYPKIEYPVATETQMISHFVDWEHSEHWPELVSNEKDMVTATSREFIMSVHDDEFKYISGHIRDGNNVFPESALLFTVMETLTLYKGVNCKDISVVFRDVQFYTEAIIMLEEPLKLSFVINKGNDYFEVTQDEVMLVNGYVSSVRKPEFFSVPNKDKENEKVTQNIDSLRENDICLESEDIYQHLHAKGLTYKGEFQSIKSTNFKRTTALIKKSENWITLLDSLIQLNILARDDDAIAVPKMIKKLTISLDMFRKEKTTIVNNEHYYNANLYNIYDVTRCGGIEIKQIIFDKKSRKQQKSDALESLVFVPHSVADDLDINTAVKINLQLVADNVVDKVLTVTEVLCDTNSSISSVIEDVAEFLPEINVNIRTVDLKDVKKNIKNSNLIILLNSFKNGKSINDDLITLEDAFILTCDQSEFKNGHFNVICSMNVEGKKFVLLKKKNEHAEVNKTYLQIKNYNKFEWVPILKGELHKINKVVLVSEKNPYCGLIGLVKTLRKEYPNKVQLVVIEDYNASFDVNKPLFKEQLQKGLAFNILKKGQWGNYYYQQMNVPNNVQNIKLMNIVPGDSDSLKWVEAPTKTASENLVQVCYAGLSLRDSQKAVGMIECDEEGLGYDFSGFNTNGERVMGLISSGAIASTVEADPQLLWQVPKNWSLEDAATVPLPYVHACYCLAIKGQLQKRHSIFVNGGAGALGQAIISISLALGCTVYTSVSDERKKQFLLKLFPKLQENNIAKSQYGDLHAVINLNTNGRGCDFVVNCARGEMREAAMNCVAPFGVFIDVNDIDWKANKPIGMSYIQRDRTYIASSLSSLFRQDNLKERKMLQWIIAEGIGNGIIKPITRVIYSTTEVSRAFRLLTSNRHRGRVLFKIRNAEIASINLNVIARTTYSASGTYIVICDETELGIELANGFVSRGARKIMLHLKSKNVPGYVHLKLATWMNFGTQVKISTEKLNSDQSCAKFLLEAGKLGRIHGIFIVQESSENSENWTKTDFEQKYENVSSVITKLDVMSRNNSPDLSHFVVITRSPQNVSDSYITSVSERICHDRLKIGLPAVCFKIELLDELYADNQSHKLEPQNITTVLNSLEESEKLKQSTTVTFNLKKLKHSEYLAKIFRCLGLDNLDNIEPRLTINDVITNDIQLEEFKAIMKDTCKVDYTAEKLKGLTIDRLKSFMKKDVKKNHKFNSKLGAFYTFVDEDEYMATNAMVSMKTIISRNDTTEELNKNATHLFLIPGFEGHHHIFKPICERLKVRAVTFQICPDTNAENIPEMAKDILKEIKKNFIFKTKFYLLGYSFGVNVALEVAALLEKEGYDGVVCCLDSSPEALRAQLNAYIGNQTDRQLQNSIVNHFFELMSGQKDTELNEALENLDNWSDKVEICIKTLKKLVSCYTSQYIQNVLDSAYRRIILAKNYKPSLRLKSELVLLKGLPHPNLGSLANDYGLSEYTKESVRIIDIASDHATTLQDCRVSNIINKLIDPELLEDYKKNLFLTYEAE